MRVAVVGAGVAGLVAAYRLGQAGHDCDVYERWPGLGGQAATIDIGGGRLLERYYHHWFTSDRHIVELYTELGLDGEVEWHPSRVAWFAGGQAHAFNGALDLLRFSPLSPISRVRVGAAVLLLQRRHPDPGALEDRTARDWIEHAMGSSAWENMWGPLLRGKFGSRADEISMAWLWGKLTLRRRLGGDDARGERLGYPRSSFEPLFAALRDRIAQAGGRVLIDRPAARIARAQDGSFEIAAGAPGSFRRGHDPSDFDQDPTPEHYDAVLATVPNDLFETLLDPGLVAELAPGVLERARSIEYHAALCLLLELDRPFSEHYWMNIAESGVPFIGLIEHTNLVPAERYGGRRFLYVANYVERDDPLLELEPDELLVHYEPGLRRVNPAFERAWVRERWLHREPAAQPIVTVGYRERMPPLRTGARGLVLANTTQIYPEDRGTNYAVRLGDQAVAALLADLSDGCR